MGSGSRIGHFTVARGMHRMVLGNNGRIGQWNWMSAAAFSPAEGADLRGHLILGKDSSITSRHYLDCSGGITIGNFTTIGGVRSTFLTHQIDLIQSIQTSQHLSIGDYCFIGSDVRLVPGAKIGDRVVVAMGAVVVGSLDQSYTVYGGVPASPIKTMGHAGYFQRKSGFVNS
jgi:acetyltransferase-like isoleucine patch superfamily enzyme